MEVLVSVVNEEQVDQAARAGATWIDLKDPAHGPLGRASDAFQRAAVERLTTWPAVKRSVALGELLESDWAGAPPQPQPGFAFAKLGTSGMSPGRDLGLAPAVAWRRWLEWRAGLPQGCAAVLVAYADADRCRGLTIDAALNLAGEWGLPYLLIDTFDKSGGGLMATLDRQEQRAQLPRWIQAGRRQGTCIAWAGQLNWSELLQLRDCGAEIVGVRSAICRTDPAGRPQRQGEICPERLAQVLTLNDGPAQVSSGRTTWASSTPVNRTFSPRNG